MKNRTIIIIAYLLSATLVSFAASTQKKLLFIYKTHPFTFFCEEPFSANGELTITPCPNCSPLTQKIQWMHVIPLKRLAQDLPCFDNTLCTDKQGKRFKGLRCCQQISTVYQKMRLDPMNLVPENPLLKKQRSDYVYRATEDSRPLGFRQCHLTIDKEEKTIVPSPLVRGMIARIAFYMHKQYGLHLSTAERTLYTQWDHQFPMSNWERERNERIQSSAAKLL